MKTKPPKWEKEFDKKFSKRQFLGMSGPYHKNELKSFIQKTIDQEVKEAFRDGWLEVIGWINGEVVLDETLSDESKRAFKKILEMWIDEWKNSVKLKLLGKKG